MAFEELNRQVFQALYFMQQVYKLMEKGAEDDEDNLDEYWGVEVDQDEGGPAAYVVVEMRRKGKKDSALDVARWFPQPGCDDQLPLYINVLREDEEDVWEDLKAEFPEAKVFEDDMRLGFDWTLPPDATRDAIREAGRAFGRRVARAIWGED